MTSFKPVFRTLGVAAVLFGVAALSASAQVSATLDASTGVNVGNATAVQANVNVGADANANLSNFILTRGQLSASSTAYVAAANVVSSDDFSAYAQSAMVADSNLVKVASGDDHVAVSYKEPAKLFGFISADMNVQATVNADGTVTVNYPWWRVFAKYDSSAQLQTDLDTTAGTLARSDASVTLSSSAKARLVNAIRSVMKAHHDSLSADASANASANTQY